jgi:disulfide bond formation protein DsbB
MSLPNSRITFALIALGCAAGLATALYMEYGMGLAPCPMCMMQRVAMIAAGAVALVAAIHGPGASGNRTYAALTAAIGVTGAGVAGRQVWLQSLPADQVPACGASLDYMLDVFPLLEVLQKVLAGDGTCAEVVWTFLGLSIPAWTFIAFAAVVTGAVIQLARPR